MRSADNFKYLMGQNKLKMDIFKGQNQLEFSDRFKTDLVCMQYLAEIKWGRVADAESAGTPVAKPAGTSRAPAAPAATLSLRRPTRFPSGKVWTVRGLSDLLRDVLCFE